MIPKKMEVINMSDRTILEVYLTTTDNPYDPSVQWDEWKAFDEGMGYYSSQYLARVAKTSDELSNADYLATINDAIDRILAINPLGIYRKHIIYG
jgi:hypothetical protein